ncbi:MAG: hypothetical protein ACI4LI_08045 [Candidatus Fimenecus sp.]
MNTTRVAKLYFRQMRLPFLICFGLAVLSEVTQTLFWKMFDLFVPSTFFLSAAFYFIFILWNGKTFDRLFLQFSVSRRAQLCGFFAFLPAALLGALCNAGIASIAILTQIDWQDTAAIPSVFVSLFQEFILLQPLFVGSVGKVVFLSVLFQAVNSMRWMVVARMIVAFRRLLPVWARVVLGFLSAQTLFWFGLGDFFASEDGDLPLGEIPYTFCFGNISTVGILLSRLATTGICAGVLVLCMYKNRKRKIIGKCKAKQTRRTALALAGIALSVAAGAFSVCFCSPAVVNILEYTSPTVSAVPYAGDDETDTVYFAPNEKAYRLLRAQKKFATDIYRRKLAYHMAAVYFPPNTEVVPDADYTVGKQYYELYFSCADTADEIIFYDSVYDFNFPRYGIGLSWPYFQYMYQNGDKDEAFAFLESNATANIYINENDFPIWVYRNGTEEEALRVENVVIQHALSDNADMALLQTLLDTAPSRAVYEKVQTDILEIYAPQVRATRQNTLEGDFPLPPYYAEGGEATQDEVQRFITGQKEFAQEQLDDLNALCEQAQKPYPGV